MLLFSPEKLPILSLVRREKEERLAVAHFFLLGGHLIEFPINFPFGGKNDPISEYYTRMKNMALEPNLFVLVSVSSTGNQSFLRVKWVCTEEEKYFLKLECCYWITKPID